VWLAEQLGAGLSEIEPPPSLFISWWFGVVISLAFLHSSQLIVFASCFFDSFISTVFITIIIALIN